MYLHSYSFFKHSQYKVTRSLQDFSGNTCIAASWWFFFQWHYFFFRPPPPTVFSFIHPDVHRLPHRIARGAGRDPGQPVSTGSSEVVTQQRLCVSLQSGAAVLTRNLPGGRPCLWHWMCPQFLLILIWMEGRMCPPLNLRMWGCPTEANNPRNRGSVWSEDYLRLNQRRRLAVL